MKVPYGRQHSSSRYRKGWTDPATNQPVQVTFNASEAGYGTWTYTSIQINAELDDDLFSFEPPEGHTTQVRTSSAGRHASQYPGELAELVTAGFVSDEKLRNLLSRSDDPEGRAVIRYLQPRPDADRSTEIIFYEAYEQWPEEGIAVCFAIGNIEVIADQKLFEELIR